MKNKKKAGDIFLATLGLHLGQRSASLVYRVLAIGVHDAVLQPALC